jgi:mRNA-degrading endonuclease YafQ of YafQ-DinJ toxin-antitoxin module
MRLRPFKPAWNVKIEDEAAAIFDQGILTADDKTVLRLWITTVRDGGPEALAAKASVWNDHPLTGKWAGHRASNFSYQGRIIYYEVREPEKTVVVVRITADHNYK